MKSTTTTMTTTSKNLHQQFLKATTPLTFFFFFLILTLNNQVSFSFLLSTTASTTTVGATTTTTTTTTTTRAATTKRTTPCFEKNHVFDLETKMHNHPAQHQHQNCIISKQSLCSSRTQIRLETTTSSSSSSFSSSTTALSARGGGGGIGEEEGESEPASFLNVSKLTSFASKNFFLLGMIVAVSFAKLFPQLGKNGGILKPELFIGKFGVTTIFLLSGLSLKLNDLKDAVSNIQLNSLIQFMSFVAWPFLFMVPLIKLIQKFVPTLFPQPLLDGLLILSCLPTTINMCVILTSAAGGNVASSLCNAVISNMMGIFVTPALFLKFFGKSIELPFGQMVVKLCNKVLLPVFIGQALRATPAKQLYNDHSKKFKRFQEIILLSIVWNAFCEAFLRGMGMEMRHGIALLTLLPLLHSSVLAILFYIFKFCGFPRKDVVSAMFCSSQKTLAFGLPLVNTVFEGNPNLASYCAPLMFIHPLQLVLGSLFLPLFSKFAATEEKEG